MVKNIIWKKIEVNIIISAKQLVLENGCIATCLQGFPSCRLSYVIKDEKDSEIHLQVYIMQTTCLS